MNFKPFSIAATVLLSAHKDSLALLTKGNQPDSAEDARLAYCNNLPSGGINSNTLNAMEDSDEPYIFDVHQLFGQWCPELFQKDTKDTVHNPSDDTIPGP